MCYSYDERLCLHIFFFFFQWRYSPGWASASFKSFLHSFRFRAATVQFLHPRFSTFSFTPSSQRNLGLPLGRFPPGSRRTLVAKSSSSWRMICPAYLSLLNVYTSGYQFLGDTSPLWKSVYVCIKHTVMHQHNQQFRMINSFDLLFSPLSSSFKHF